KLYFIFIFLYFMWLGHFTFTAGLCKTRPTDLVFIIDSSRSVRPSEFEQVKVFLAKVIEGLDVGPNATRVGVVNYASRVKNEVSLKTHKTKAGLVKAVTKIEPLSTGTMTGLAIQFALNVAFSEAEGARKSNEISKVAIIVTDGRPQDNVKDIAQRARDAGIEIFAIGVGRVDMSTLKQMASDPLDDHVDYVESYSVIEKLTKKFQEAFCVSDQCATGDHDCEQVCISTPGSFKCACKEGFTLMDDGRSCSGECACAPEDPCECDSLVKFQKKVEDALQALTKKYILYFNTSIATILVCECLFLLYYFLSLLWSSLTNASLESMSKRIALLENKIV
uniref:VWFA domain-containing protein n=1 Tax=Periophthalmus magnuspinnatus TaxID=409849 RepID=A0A3B3ZR90_9GOBI